MRNSSTLAASLSFVVLCIALFVVPYGLQDVYQIDVASRIVQSLLLVMSLHLVLTIGRLNLAHTAFMGVAAYISAALTMHLGLSSWLSGPIAILTASVVSVLLAITILRLTGAYFFLVTFAFLNIVVLFFQSFFEDFFGGASGLIGVPGPSAIRFGSYSFSFDTRIKLYYLALVMFVIVGGLLLRLNYSRFGLICNALRQSEKLAGALGVNPLRYKTIAFVTSSAAAATVGVFFAHSQKVVQYNDFNINAMLRLVVFVVVGGIGTIWGAIVGTLVISILAEFLRGFYAYETLIYGAIIVGTMLFLPEGMAGLMHRLWVARLGEK